MWLQLTSESFLPRINLITPLENETSVIISYTETSFINNENLGVDRAIFRILMSRLMKPKLRTLKLYFSPSQRVCK